MEHIDAASALAALKADRSAEARALQPENALAQKRKEIAEMYAIFKNEVDVDTVLTRSEFSKFEKLFSMELAQEIRTREISKEETEDLKALSDEYMERVNVYRPVHIVEDYDHSKEITTLPPVFRKPETLSSEDAQVIDAFTGLAENPNAASSPIVQSKQDQVALLLNETIDRNQNIEKLKADMANFEAIARKFHKEVLGNDPFEPVKVNKDEAVASQIEQARATAPSEDDSPDDDFEF